MVEEALAGDAKPARKQQQRSIVTQQKLLDAAISAFSENGFKGTSTRDIADRAGVHHPLITYHFKNKDQLWRAAADRIFREFNISLVKAMSEVPEVDPRARAETFIRTYVRPVQLVPDSKNIDKLFLEMQRERESLAVVVNEFGACIGIVSLEDIIEQIFGELVDEHEDATPEIREFGPGHYRASARADIDDFNDQTGFDLPKIGYETVGGYVLYRLGRVPQKGETFVDGALTVTIVDADRYGVRMVDIASRESSGGDESSPTAPPPA